MKFFKNYYDALRPVGLPLIFSIIAYLLGYGNEFLVERIVLCLVGGLLIVGFWYLMNFFKKKSRKSSI